MLYLLRSYTKDGSMLKVGYANDYEYRLNQYRTHNPGIEEILKREGNLIDETKLHLYFYCLGYGVYRDEWYRDCQEVIDAFEIDLEEVDNYLWNNRNVVFLGKISEKNSIICEIYRTLRDKFYTTETEDQDVDRYFKMRLEKKKIKDLETRLGLSEESMLSESEKILKRFLSLGSFPEKMKFLCESSFSDVEIGLVLDQIPLQYKNYFLGLGPARCRALGYNVTKISKELSDVIIEQDLDDLSDKIYERFTIGGKYSKSEVKAALGEIYNEIGYNKTPKATDLDEYFVIGNCRLPNSETGKRDAGIEIIKRK